jgi:hypothetical protein
MIGRPGVNVGRAYMARSGISGTYGDSQRNSLASKSSLSAWRHLKRVGAFENIDQTRRCNRKSIVVDGRWWTFDARHNVPRIGRVLIATGLDAAEVAITTAFGSSILSKFEIVTELVDSEESAVQNQALGAG